MSIALLKDVSSRRKTHLALIIHKGILHEFSCKKLWILLKGSVQWKIWKKNYQIFFLNALLTLYDQWDKRYDVNGKWQTLTVSPVNSDKNFCFSFGIEGRVLSFLHWKQMTSLYKSQNKRFWKSNSYFSHNSILKLSRTVFPRFSRPHLPRTSN